MSTTAKWIIAIIVIILIVAGVWYYGAKTPTAPVETGPIKIGWIGPLTGNASNIGLNAQAATQIAIDEINQAGGAGGRQLEVVYEDGKCDSNSAASAANKLINIDKVPVILGGACSGETSAFAPTAKQAGVVVFSYCSSAPALSSAGIFRDYPSDTGQGAFAANYLYNTLGKKNIAVLYVKTDWGQGIKDVFGAELKKLGGTVAIEESYDQKSPDFRTSLTKVKAAKPDAIYFLGYTEETIIGLKQMKEFGINTTLFGGDTWDDSAIYSRAGKSAEGIMYVMPQAPLNDAFKAAMQNKLGKDEITICSPQAYDAAKILAQVLAKAGTDSAAIRAGLSQTQYSGGVSANSISFDQNGDLIGGSYIVKKVQNGKAAPIQ